MSLQQRNKFLMKKYLIAIESKCIFLCNMLNFSKPSLKTLNCPMLRDKTLMVEDNMSHLSKVMLVAASGPLALTAVETKTR